MSNLLREHTPFPPPVGGTLVEEKNIEAEAKPTRLDLNFHSLHGCDIQHKTNRTLAQCEARNVQNREP